MSEYPESLDQALESQLKTLAPGVPSELEVERMAARARQVTTARARTGWRSWQLATTVATLVVFAGGLALIDGLGGIGHRVPASSTTLTTHAAPSPRSAASTSSAGLHPENMRLAYPDVGTLRGENRLRFGYSGTDVPGPWYAPGGNDPSARNYSPTRLPPWSGALPQVMLVPYSNLQFINRGAFNSRNFGRLTTHDLEKRYGVTLSFPRKAAGGDYQGILHEPEADNGRTAYNAIYSNDTIVQVQVFASTLDAKRWIGDAGSGESLASYVTTHTIGGGVVAYATPKLTRTQIIRSRGRMVMASQFNAGVTWTRGRFGISVMSPDRGVNELLGVARDITFELTSTVK